LSIIDYRSLPSWFKQELKKIIGKPYKFNCFDGTGFDCYTLTYYIYKLIGITLPKVNIAVYSLRQNAKLIKDNSLQFKPIPFSERQPFDILLFKSSEVIDAHLAVLLDREHFIHIDKNITVRIEPIQFNISSIQLKRVYRWLSLN